MLWPEQESVLKRSASRLTKLMVVVLLLSPTAVGAQSGLLGSRLGNLPRVVSGRPTSADLASLIWSHVRHVVPNASCAFFIDEPASDAVKVAFVAGGQLAGVLSLYSAESFTEDQTETLDFVMPHLGQMFLSLPRRGGDSPPVAAAKPSLRVVASR